MAPPPFCVFSVEEYPREFFKLADSGELAPGFNFAIFDDFSKKTQGPASLFPKKSDEKSEKFFLEIIEERVSYLFFSTLAGVPPFFLEVHQSCPPVNVE